MKDELLPIGTIVLLKGANVELMIIGYKALVETKEGKKHMDYIACRVPEGKTDSSSNRFFNKEDIYKIIKIGYIDEKWNDFKKIVEK